MIPYYEPFNGRPPIVERVPECRPLHVSLNGTMLTMLRISGDVFWVEDGTHKKVGLCSPDVAAALTRDAIKCWFATVKVSAVVASQIMRAVYIVDHDKLNAEAQSIADALEENKPPV